VRHDDTDGQPEEAVDAPHPFGVATRQVVVDGDDVHALAGQRVEVGGERGDQRLAFAGAHLGDLALVEHRAADQLHVEVTHAQRALARLADNGKGLRLDRFQRFALGQTLAELRGLRRQLGVDHRGIFRFEGAYAPGEAL
jgi:hypothetical protein